jgi:hypothetical protein
MKRKLLARRPSPAMVVAVVALVSSLTGGALAAALIDTGDIQNGAVTKKKVHKNAVNSKKVKNKTLKAKDFAPGQLAQGVQGIQGLQGEKGDKGEPGDDGAPGATNVVYRQEIQDGIGNTTFAEAEPSCETGETLIGGGGYFVNNANQGIDLSGTITANGPGVGASASSTPSNWYVSGRNTTGSTKRFFGYAICASP